MKYLAKIKQSCARNAINNHFLQFHSALKQNASEKSGYFYEKYFRAPPAIYRNLPRGLAKWKFIREMVRTRHRTVRPDKRGPVKRGTDKRGSTAVEFQNGFRGFLIYLIAW